MSGGKHSPCWHDSLLGWVHFPPQPRRLGKDANPSGYLPFRRYLPLPFLRHLRFRSLVPAMAHLVVEVDPMNRLAILRRQLHSLPRHPLRDEALVAGADSLG